MKVISIFKKHPFDEFCADLVHLIENNTGKRPTDEIIERCRKVYDKVLAEYQPQPTTLRIRLVSRWEYCSPMIDMNCAVFENRDLCGAGAALAHKSRNEFLNLPVRCDRDVELTETELAAGLFFEMTYYPPEKDIELMFWRKHKPTQ